MYNKNTEEFDDNEKSYRPKVSKPRLQTWKSTDEELNTLFDQAREKVFNLEMWEFPVYKENRFIEFNELLASIKDLDTSATRTTVLTLQIAFFSLPARFKEIEKNLFDILNRFTLNTQEQLNVIEEFELYTNQKEDEILSLKEEIHDLKERQIQEKVIPPVIDVDAPAITPTEELPLTEVIKEESEQKKQKEASEVISEKEKEKKDALDKLLT